MIDLDCRSCIGICRENIYMNDFWSRIINIIDLYYRNYLGICKGNVCVSVLCRRSYCSVCRGSVICVPEGRRENMLY